MHGKVSCKSCYLMTNTSRPGGVIPLLQTPNSDLVRLAGYDFGAQCPVYDRDSWRCHGVDTSYNPESMQLSLSNLYPTPDLDPAYQDHSHSSGTCIAGSAHPPCPPSQSMTRRRAKILTDASARCAPTLPRIITGTAVKDGSLVLDGMPINTLACASKMPSIRVGNLHISNCSHRLSPRRRRSLDA